jgi:hypothetical protein
MYVVGSGLRAEWQFRSPVPTAYGWWFTGRDSTLQQHMRQRLDYISGHPGPGWCSLATQLSLLGLPNAVEHGTVSTMTPV